MAVKNRILDISSQIFSKKGISKTKLQEIATEVGISKKTIYKYFESKDDLVLSLYGALAQRINSTIESLFSSDLTLTTKLVGLLTVVQENLQFVTPELVSDVRQSYPKVEEFVKEYMKHALFERFKKLIETGIRDGDIGENVKIESTILLYREAIFSFLYMRSTEDVPVGFYRNPLHLFIESLATIFRGILTEEAEKEFDRELSTLNI